MRGLWIWVKVVACLLVIEIVLFHLGVFWRMTPDFSHEVSQATWSQVYTAAREFETRTQLPNGVFLVGDSIVLTGVDPALVAQSLRQADVPVNALSVAAYGTSVTDAAIMTWSGRQLAPWLVVYGIEAHNFKKPGGFITTDTPIKRVFYDASIELPLLPRRGAEATLDAWVMRYWKLYRYRFFARTLLSTAGRRSWQAVREHAPRAQAQAPPPFQALPLAAQKYFDPIRVTPKSYAVWERWRASRRFADYAAWLSAGPAGDSLLNFYYKMETMERCGPQDNAHIASLEWMLDSLQQRGTRTVLVYFPENPVFHDPEARPYFDEQLSDAYAGLLAREAASHDGRFVDLRNFLPAEDFMDLRHPNLEGMRLLSQRIAAIIEEEWRARGEAPKSTPP